MTTTTTTTVSITHEQAHGLRTGSRTADDWKRGVETARRHANKPSLMAARMGHSVLSPVEYAQGMANLAWAEGDVMAAAFWCGYAAGAIRFGKVEGMAVIAVR
jgi:hypothetical protein